MKQPFSHRSLIAAFSIGVLVILLSPQLPPGHLQQGLIQFTLWGVAAFLWAGVLSGPPLERQTSGAGLSLLTPLLLTLGASYLPGPMPSAVLALVALAALLVPFTAAMVAKWTLIQDEGIAKWTTRQLWVVAGILLLAATLRMANMDYKEFQGDEGIIMVRAAQSIMGEEAALLQHQKGPVEILIPLLSWGLSGSINELWARAAFAWAGILVVAALAELARRWFSPAVALLAALIFALNGFGIAFARIVQYQSLVMLWTLLSLSHAHRYQRSGRFVDLALCAIFLAGGLLAHYDAVLAAPAIAWMVAARWRKTPRQALEHGARAALIALVILGAFYGPYVFNPTFGDTGSYLLRDRLGATFFSWSVPEVWQMATFYNSIYYVLLLLLLTAIGLTVIRRQRASFAAALHFLVPLTFYALVVADPRTHIYTFFPGLTILSAVGAISLWQSSLSDRLRQVGVAILVLTLAASLVYVYLIFIDVTPERQRTWAQNRPLYFPTTWTEPPQFGLFGFPHQAGWRVIPSLVNQLPYASNEEAPVTDWYMAQAPRTHCPDFETFVVAANTQDALPFEEDLVRQRPLQAVITVNGTPSAQVYANEPTGPIQVEASDRDLWRIPGEIAPPSYAGEVAVNATLGGSIRLLGYTLSSDTVMPGEAVTIVLYWQALAPIERNYQVFVHLFDGTMWAQSDGAPDCTIQPTSGWEPGQIVRDAHTLRVPAGAPEREIPLLAGMYDLITTDRLPIAETGNDHIRLTHVKIGASGN